MLIDPVELAQLKVFLSEVKPGLETISGRLDPTQPGVRLGILPIGHNSVRTIELITDIFPYGEPPVAPLVSAFVNTVFSDKNHHGEPSYLHGYCGVVGDAGQLYDVWHTDYDILRRETVTIVDTDCQVNPSVRLAQAAADNIAQYVELKNLPPNLACDDINPQLMLEPGAEGAITPIGFQQAHAEKTLPPGTAKLALFATYT
jgi:hypothetical protein